jgi:hypothetical protein
MKAKRILMTVLLGLAMLATPITAAAKDHRGPRARWMPAPAPVARRQWREDHHEWKHGWGDADDYRNYGYRGYYAAPVYGAPVYAAPAYPAAPYYGGGYARRGPCRRAQSVVNNYYRDRNTGHPAAAFDLLRQNRWAFNSGCVSGTPMGGGLLGGLGGFGGAPGYANYGGYGYGQPYGGTSMLAPLLQYIR